LTEVKVIGRTESVSYDPERTRFINPNKPGAVENVLAQIAARMAFDTWKNSEQSPVDMLERPEPIREGK